MQALHDSYTYFAYTKYVNHSFPQVISSAMKLRELEYKSGIKGLQMLIWHALFMGESVYRNSGTMKNKHLCYVHH